MIIRNKKSGAESIVTQEQWEKIKANRHLSDKFIVIDSSEINKKISESIKNRNVIIPQEIINFRKQKIEELKSEPKEEIKKTNKKKEK